MSYVVKLSDNLYIKRTAYGRLFQHGGWSHETGKIIKGKITTDINEARRYTRKYDADIIMRDYRAILNYPKAEIIKV